MASSRRPAGFVVLSSGWAGESLLVRLLSAGGHVRIGGHVLEDPVRAPAKRVRDAVRATGDDRCRGVLVQPHHLWLRNGVDPDAFVAALVDDGIVVLSLRRSDHVDRGLSRALCGPRAEVLPTSARLVDASDVAVFAKEDELAAEWFGSVVPEEELRLVFETDLATDGARAATAERLARRLALGSAPAPPPEPDVPTHEALWARVQDAGRLQQRLCERRGARG